MGSKPFVYGFGGEGGGASYRGGEGGLGHWDKKKCWSTETKILKVKLSQRGEGGKSSSHYSRAAEEKKRGGGAAIAINGGSQNSTLKKIDGDGICDMGEGREGGKRGLFEKREERKKGLAL